MKHDKKEVELEFDLPGFDKKDIKVNINEDSAEIIAEKTNEKKTDNKGFFHHEKSYQGFYYHTNIPRINSKKVKTDFKNGKLTIKANKVLEKK